MTVDGVIGRPYWCSTPIGNIRPAGLVRLGGRSTLAGIDSPDGWISSVNIHAVLGHRLTLRSGFGRAWCGLVPVAPALRVAEAWQPV